MTDDEIRPFRPADRASYLDLYGTVFGAAPDAEWFEWKYGSENPYVDEPAIFVAIRDGDVVGARSFFALRMATGGTTRVALQPSDAMVHPDHRRRGLFSELTTAALDHYADREPEFCFNFPNPQSLPGNLKLGWTVVGELTTHYRVHDPAALSTAVPSLLEAPLRASAAAYYRFRTPAPAAALDVTVHRQEPPTETLSALYRRSQRDGLHARRDESFYEWRLASPGRTYETYVAERGGEPTAALVIGRDARAGTSTTRVLDALAVGESATRRAAYRTLLATVLAAHDDATLVAVRGGIPVDVLRRFGFLPDTSLPLSLSSSTSTMVARPIGDAGWTVNGSDLRDPESWQLTFAELDSA